MRLQVSGRELISGLSTLWRFKIGRSVWAGLHRSAVLGRHLLVELREHCGVLHSEARTSKVTLGTESHVEQAATDEPEVWWPYLKFLPWLQSARLCPRSFISDQETQQWPSQGQRYVVSIPYVVYTVTLEKHVREKSAFPTNPRSNPSHRHSNPNKDTWRKLSFSKYHRSREHPSKGNNKLARSSFIGDR